MKLTKEIYLKFIWSIMPFIWGLFSLSLSYYIKTKQIKWVIETLSVLIIIIWYFGKKFNENKIFTPTIFGYQIKIPTWRFITITSIILFFGGLIVGLIMNSNEISAFVRGTFLQPLVEEFLTQSCFVALSYSWMSFIIFKFISAISFSLIHFSNYTLTFSSILGAILNHGLFNLNLGIIAFRTKRIEIPILLHIFSNLDYVITTSVLGFKYTLAHGLIKLFILIISIFIFSNKQ